MRAACWSRSSPVLEGPDQPLHDHRGAGHEARRRVRVRREGQQSVPLSAGCDQVAVLILEADAPLAVISGRTPSVSAYASGASSLPCARESQKRRLPAEVRDPGGSTAQISRCSCWARCSAKLITCGVDLSEPCAPLRHDRSSLPKRCGVSPGTQNCQWAALC
jgi:hypothetical protein